MLLTFLDKLGGFFERSFIVACWMPVFIAAGLFGGVLGTVVGWDRALSWWSGMRVIEHGLLGVAALIAVTVLAYLLQAITATIVRLYEGYSWWGRLANWAGLGQKNVERPSTAKPPHSRDSSAHPFYYDFHYPPPLMPEGKTEVAIKFPDSDSQPQEEEDG